MHNTRVKLSTEHFAGKQDFNRKLAANCVFSRSDSPPSRRTAHYDGFISFLQSLTEAAKAVPGVLVTCQRSPELVFLKWKGIEVTPREIFSFAVDPAPCGFPGERQGIHPDAISSRGTREQSHLHSHLLVTKSVER